MRICYVAYQFWPSVGGSQAQAEKQAGYLSQSGQEVLVVTLRHQKAWPAHEMYRSFSVVRVGGWYRRGGTLRAGRFAYLLVNVLLFFTLWRLRRKYDLIHTLQLSPQAAVAALIGKLARKPVIIGVQSTGPYEVLKDLSVEEVPESLEHRGAEQVPVTGGEREQTKGGETTKAVAVGRKPALSRVATAYAAGDSSGQPGRGNTRLKAEIGGDLAQLRQMAWGGQKMLDYIRKADVYYQILSSRSYLYLLHHDFRQERIIYVPNGVDTQQFCPVSWLKPDEMVQRTERVFICVARLEYAKGVDILLQAWAQMMELLPVWREGLQPRLRLVGDGTCRAQLERLAVELGIQESVEFLGTRLDVPALLQEAWGFVLPSRWEGMPNALLEAMSCALPCVATRVSGSEDMLEQGLNGLLVEPEEPRQLAYALRLLIEDTDLATRLGRLGYETVRRYYQLGTAVQGCLAFYRYLLSREDARHGWTSAFQFDDLSPWRQGYE